MDPLILNEKKKGKRKRKGWETKIKSNQIATLEKHLKKIKKAIECFQVKKKYQDTRKKISL